MQIISTRGIARLGVGIFVCASVVLTLPAVRAADTTWSNTGTDFNTAASWNNGVPGAADRAIFTGAAVTQPNLSSSTTIMNLQFGSATTSSGYTVSSADANTKLTVTSNATGTGTQAIVTQNTSGTNTFSAPIVLGAAANSTQTISVTSGGTLVLSGIVSEQNSNVKLSKTGNGTLLMSGSNSYTGGTAITAGTLQLGNGTTNGSFSTSGTIAISSGATFAVNTTGQSITNAITGNGSVLKTGSGILTLNSASSSYAGGTTISLGAVTWSNDAALGSGAITLNDAATTGNTSLQRSSGGSLSNNIVVANAGTGGVTTIGRTLSTGTQTNYNGTITLNKSATFENAGGTLQINGAISGAGGVTVSGNGTTIFAADIAYTGTTTISGGVLRIANGPAGELVGDIVVNSALQVDRTNALTLSGTISGNNNGSLTKQGTGTLTLTAANTYGGTLGTTISAGTLAVNNIPALGSGTGSGGVTVNGDGTLSGTGSVAGAVTLNNTSHLAAGGSGSTESLAIGVVATPVSLTFNNTSNFDYEIKSDASLAAAADLVDLKGNVTIGASAALNISDVASTAMVIGGGTKLTLISYTGTLTGTFASRPNGSMVTLGPNAFTLKYDDTTGGLNFGGGTGSKFVTLTSLAAVPEASVVVFGGLLCVAIFGGVAVRAVRNGRGLAAKCAVSRLPAGPLL